MSKIDQTIHHFYNLTSIPCSYYVNNQLKFFYPNTWKSFSTPVLIKQQLFDSDKEVDYYGSEFFGYFAVINLGPEKNKKVVVGPVLQINLQGKLLEIMKKKYLIYDKNDKFNEFVSSLPILSLNQLLYKLSSLLYFLTGKAKDIDIISNFNINDISDYTIVDKTYTVKENNAYNNSFHVESLLCSYVENGDIEKINSFVHSSFNINEGTIANNQLRQNKNTAIVSITLLTRAAIRGGVETDYAYQLSDAAIRQIENLNSFLDIQNLVQKILMRLTLKVRALKELSDGNEFLRITRYIRDNINSPLRVTDISNTFGYSRSYLSTAFKRVNQISLKDFIMKTKIEEAKKLLIYTNKSISTISSYLCFSSQSHFQQIFKKVTCTTPLNFRKKYSNF